jgi:CcmD family protein
MSYSIVAFAVVMLGIVAYCWFLGVMQSRLTKSVEMIERLQSQTNSHRVSKQRAA